MKKLIKTFGLTLKQINKVLKIKDERGFVLIELIIGLPLILILLWSMNNMLINTWQKCRYAVADFILQQEMETTMARIINDAKKAQYVSCDTYDLRLRYYALTQFSNFQFNDKDKLKQVQKKTSLTNMQKANKLLIPVQNNDDLFTIEYIKNGYNMYRQVSFDGVARNPITGDSSLSETRITNFDCTFDKESKLLTIRLEAKSNISQHKIMLRTKIFVRGYHES